MHKIGMLVEEKDGQLIGTVTTGGSVVTCSAGTIENLSEQMRSLLAGINVWVKEFDITYN